MMVVHVMLHTVSVAVVDAPSPEEAVKIASKDRSLFKPLNEEFVAHRLQEKDLN